jgi:acetyl esterase/lipase
MWFGCGSEERGLDGNKAVASRAAQCGVPVLWNEYAGMPHEFAMLMGGIPQAKHCLKAWANACNAMVAGQVIRSQGKLM